MSVLNSLDHTPPLSGHYPAWMAVQLRQASRVHDAFERLKAIDDVTDALASMGYCRERDSISRLEEWNVARRLWA